MKIIMRASDFDPERKPKKARRTYKIGLAVSGLAVAMLAVGGATLCVEAAQPPVEPMAVRSGTPAVQAVQPVPDTADEPAAAPERVSAGTVQASSSQTAYTPAGTGGMGLAGGLPEPETRAEPDAAGDEAVQEAAVQEQPAAPAEPAAAPAEEKPAQEPVQAPEPENTVQEEPEPAEQEEPEPAAEAEQGPPEWLVPDAPETIPATEAEQGPPEWLFGPPEPDVPEWATGTLDRAVYRNPYDGGPLSQKSYAQVPCALEGADTRLYVELGAPVSTLTQGDILYFVANAVQGCDASWATIIGSDGMGIQFLNCDPGLALYGPLDEYGQVLEIRHYIMLTEYGYGMLE